MGESSSLPCITCHASCCQYRAVLTCMDAARMQHELGREVCDFTAPVGHDPDGVGFRLSPGGQRCRIALIQHTALPLRGWCTFFDPERPAGGCTIYSARPTPCRVYPATLRFGRVELRAPVVCPEGAWTSGTPLWRESWRRTAERAVTEQLIDFVINCAWNRAMGGSGNPAADTQTADDTVAATVDGTGRDADADADRDDATAAYRRYLEWAVEACRRLDAHTGCLDRTIALAPEAIRAAKAMLRR